MNLFHEQISIEIPGLGPASGPEAVPEVKPTLMHDSPSVRPKP